MSVAIKAEHLTKIYKIYERDIDRLKETNPLPKRARHLSAFTATQEQSAIMQEVANAGKTLAELANDMHGEISQFKL